REDGSSEKPSEEHFSRGVVRRYDRESECPECGYKAGVDELFCPRCGYEFKKLIRRNVVKQWSAMR
ncbi:MAG: hypothetical protein J5674_04330, partial [Candidatus Methanomethylophilaceae archaeon]|nr:hypothetical protein [Candidatus Methanomethylophilaceae archaeon]